MINLKHTINTGAPGKTRKKARKTGSSQYKRLVSIGEVSKSIIDDLYRPIDASNRFLNLALNSIDEGSQTRQFLLECKLGIRRTATLLKRLDKYAAKIEKEIREISERDK